MRIPIAWFLLALIVLAAGGIAWLIISRGTTPANAVLIASVPSPQPERTAVSLGVLSPGTPVTTKSTASPAPIAQTLVVYVSGEVTTPGVYTLPMGSRVADAVAAAGGFTEQANREGINLAARVNDEQHISVPKLGQKMEEPTVVPSATTEAVAGDASTTPSPTGAPGGKVNINTASAKELEALPGIGEVLAKRIVADREANGPFKTVDDLMRVPGIKEGVMSQLRNLVTVGP
ncbi:MAG: ComEA family DNA-binding protein [Chloroflexota bacterium]|nr:ComEA family DNA-binding protein [Chloroflexota bacterium]